MHFVLGCSYVGPQVYVGGGNGDTFKCRAVELIYRYRLTAAGEETVPVFQHV